VDLWGLVSIGGHLGYVDFLFLNVDTNILVYAQNLDAGPKMVAFTKGKGFG